MTFFGIRQRRVPNFPGAALKIWNPALTDASVNVHPHLFAGFRLCNSNDKNSRTLVLLHQKLSRMDSSDEEFFKHVTQSARLIRKRVPRTKDLRRNSDAPKASFKINFELSSSDDDKKAEPPTKIITHSLPQPRTPLTDILNEKGEKICLLFL